MFEKIKDIWHRLGPRTPMGKWVFWATLAFLVLICVNRKGNLIRWVEAGFTLRRQERQIENYVEQNRLLDEKIRNLSTDRDSLETYARENFYFSEPEEDVYILDE